MIVNKTKKTIITNKFFEKGSFGKMKGLMGEKNPAAVVFNTRFGIHTFFLRFPIDIIILDKTGKVVVLKKELKPNRIFFWNMKFNTIIELPKDSLEKSKTQIGDTILLQEESRNT